MDSQSITQLAAPGAGIPAIERFIGSLVFRLKRWRGTKESITADFQTHREGIRSLVDSVNLTRRGARVLIPRLRGLEDSSRYWSVWMTLDHLRIVNGQIAQVIGSLSKGITPPGQASTAAVKPDEHVRAEVDATYERSCDDLLAAVAAAPRLDTSGSYVHPWFGQLDGGGWQTMAAGHMGIHRAQVERIVKGLSSSRFVNRNRMKVVRSAR